MNPRRRVDEVDEDRDQYDRITPRRLTSTRIIFINPRRLTSTRIEANQSSSTYVDLNSIYQPSSTNVDSDIIVVRGGDLCFVIIIVIIAHTTTTTNKNNNKQ